jgi:hypothetical protein
LQRAGASLFKSIDSPSLQKQSCELSLNLRV